MPELLEPPNYVDLVRDKQFQGLDLETKLRVIDGYRDELKAFGVQTSQFGSDDEIEELDKYFDGQKALYSSLEKINGSKGKAIRRIGESPDEQANEIQLPVPKSIDELRKDSTEGATKSAFKAAVGESISSQDLEDYQASLPDDLDDKTRAELVSGYEKAYRGTLDNLKDVAPKAIPLVQAFRDLTSESGPKYAAARDVLVEQVKELQKNPDHQKVLQLAAEVARQDRAGGLSDLGETVERATLRAFSNVRDYGSNKEIVRLRDEKSLVPVNMNKDNFDTMLPMVGAFPVPGAMRKPTAEERKMMNDKADDMEAENKAVRTVMAIAHGNVDAIGPDTSKPLTLKNAAERSLFGFADLAPQVAVGIAAAAATKGGAVPALLASAGTQFPIIAGQRTNEFLDKGYDTETASQLGEISGLVEAPIEAISDLLPLGKFTGLNKLVSRWVGKGAANTGNRLGVNFLLNMGIENATEAAQDMTPLVVADVANALKEDYPDVDWEKELGQFKEGRVDVFLAMLPLNIIGAAGATMSQNSQREMAEKYLGDVDMLKLNGLNEEQAQAIVDETDMLKRVEMFQGAEKSPEAAAKFAQEKAQEEIDQQQVETEQDTEPTPTEAPEAVEAPAEPTQLEPEPEIDTDDPKTKQDWFLAFTEGKRGDVSEWAAQVPSGVAAEMTPDIQDAIEVTEAEIAEIVESGDVEGNENLSRLEGELGMMKGMLTALGEAGQAQTETVANEAEKIIEQAPEIAKAREAADNLARTGSPQTAAVLDEVTDADVDAEIDDVVEQVSRGEDPLAEDTTETEEPTAEVPPDIAPTEPVQQAEPVATTETVPEAEPRLTEEATPTEPAQQAEPVAETQPAQQVEPEPEAPTEAPKLNITQARLSNGKTLTVARHGKREGVKILEADGWKQTKNPNIYTKDKQRIHWNGKSRYWVVDSGGVAEKIETPVEAAGEVKDHIDETSEQEGRRAAGDVKKELVQRLEGHIEQAESEADINPGDEGKVTIDIPGDGTFTLVNTKEALGKMLSRVKRLPVKNVPDPPTKVGATRTRQISDALLDASVSTSETGKPVGMKDRHLRFYANDSVNGDKFATEVLDAAVKRNLVSAERVGEAIAEAEKRTPSPKETGAKEKSKKKKTKAKKKAATPEEDSTRQKEPKQVKLDDDNGTAIQGSASEGGEAEAMGRGDHGEGGEREDERRGVSGGEQEVAGSGDGRPGSGRQGGGRDTRLGEVDTGTVGDTPATQIEDSLRERPDVEDAEIAFRDIIMAESDADLAKLPFWKGLSDNDRAVARKLRDSIPRVYGAPDMVHHIEKGGESEVYRDPDDPSKVLKYMDSLRGEGRSFGIKAQLFVDSDGDLNYSSTGEYGENIFDLAKGRNEDLIDGVAPHKMVGMYDQNGTHYAVLDQDFIDGKLMTQDEIKAAIVRDHPEMAAGASAINGAKRNPIILAKGKDGNFYVLVDVLDAREDVVKGEAVKGNAIKDEDGRMHIIDSSIFPVTEEMFADNIQLGIMRKIIEKNLSNKAQAETSEARPTEIARTEPAGTPDPDIIYSTAPEAKEQDARYLELAKDPEANREQLQAMVDEAARAAGYNVGPVYHGTDADFTVFDKAMAGSKTDDGFAGVGFYFHIDKETAGVYGKKTIPAFLKLENPYDFEGKNFSEEVELKGGPAKFSEWLQKRGYDGAILWGQRMVLNPNQIKSADPVTYDKDGNVIPPFQRFNPESDSILYSASPEGTVTEAKKPLDTQLLEAFPGSKVSKSDNGWGVLLPNGKTINVEVGSEIPVDIPSVMKFYGVSRGEAESMARQGAAGATVPKGVRLTLPGGRTLTATEVMVLIDPARAKDSTARHEALHVARELGLFDDEQGQKVWNALIDKYGTEEKIAAAREEWTKPNGLWERVRQFFVRMMSRIGGGMDADTAMSETFSSRFWEKVVDGEERTGIRYQLPYQRRKTFPVTSVKNEAVDQLRRMVEAGELSATDPEGFQEWLDSAGVTLANDPSAGDRLIRELGKKTRTLNPRESALLVMHHRKAYNDYERLSNDQFDAVDAGNFELAATRQVDVNASLKKIDEIEEVARKTGSEAGRSLVARKIALRKDFSLMALSRKARAMQGGHPLSAEQMAELQEFADKYKALEERLAESEAKNGDLEKRVSELLDNEIKDHKQKTRRKAPGKKKEVGRRKASVLAALKAAWTATGNDFAENAPKGKGLKFQLEGEPAESQGKVDTPELRDAAKQMAEFLSESGTNSFGEFWGQVRVHLGANASQAEGVFRDAWGVVESSEGFIAPDIDPANPRQVTRAARAVQRRLVEGGLEDRDTIVDIVQQSMPDILPTKEAAMEALSGYGQFTTPSKEDADVLIRDHNAQLLQMKKLSVLQEAQKKAEQWQKEGLSDDEIGDRLDKEGLGLKATGMVRDTPSDIVRHLTSLVNEAKREIPISTKSREGQLQTAQDAAKRAVRNRISDLQEIMDKANEWRDEGLSNDEIIKRLEKEGLILKPKNLLKSDEVLDGLRKKRDDLLADYREMFPPRGATEEQKNAAAEKALDRTIAELERQLDEGDIDPKKRPPQRSSPAIDAKRARMEALRAQKQALLDAKNPKLTPEERAIRQYEANLRRRIADYNDILASGDFSPKPKKERRQLSKSELRLKRQLEDIRHDVFNKMGEYHLAHLSPLEKAVDKIRETAHLSRAFMTSIDVSAVFRQGGVVVYAHPELAKHAATEMTKALVSKQYQFESAEAIRNDELGQFAETAGLNITKDDGLITRQEEAFMGRWAKRIPLVAASGRAYTTFLNNIRFSLFKLMVSNIGRTGRVTLDEAKVIARYINVATGRADFKAFNKTAANMNTMFFAPRWVASRFQYVAMPLYLPFTKTSPRVKKAIAAEYGRTFTGAGVFVGTLMALGYLMADDDDDKPVMEFNPISSDFLKIRLGETRIDPTAGISNAIVYSSRLVSGRTKSASSGRIRKFGEGYKPTTRLTLTQDYLRTKLAPIPGAAATAMSGFTDVVGQEQTPASLVGDLFAPLSIREVRETMTAQGITKGTAISLLTLLGMGGGTYGPQTKYLAATPDERVEIFKKDLNKARWDDPPLPYDDLLTTEQVAEFEIARIYNAGLRVWQATNPAPRDRSKLDEWQESKKKAMEELKGYPRSEMPKALAVYLQKRKLSKESYYTRLALIPNE